MKITTRISALVGKSAKVTIKLLGRRATHAPGAIALKLNPNFIKDVVKPNKVMVITGTNGKTTTTNLIVDILERLKQNLISNRVGSNIDAGIASALLENTALISGKSKADLAVLEMDELWSTYLNPMVEPDTLTITNLFQDSFERNGNVYYVRERIKKGIVPSTKLILNASDPISSYLDVDNECVYFDVANIFNDQPRLDSKLQDLKYCPICNHKIVWDFNRYHHIGQYHCDHCEFQNPVAKYQVVSYDPKTNKLHCLEDGTPFEMTNLLNFVESVFNQIATYATLRENGYSQADILPLFDVIKIDETRFNTRQVGDKELITIVAKGYNPIATSRVFDNVVRSTKTKSVVYLMDSLEESSCPDKSTAWWYLIDYHFLKDVHQLIVSARFFKHDLEIALAMSGFDMSKLVLVDHHENIGQYVDLDAVEQVYVLHDIERENLAQRDKVCQEILERMAT